MNIAFKHPEFLFFLFAIAIPIIVHLFSFRRYKKVFFHSIHLLKNIQQEQNKTRTKLKHILILCARILTITFLVFAFAQPYIPNNKTTASQSPEEIIALYVDNSFSAQAESKNGILIDVMKKKAQQIIDGFPATKKFYVFSNNPYDLENTILTKEQAKKQITALSITAFTKNISEVVKKIQSLQMQDKTPVSLFICSDFQTYSSDFENIPKDSLITLQLLPFESEQKNNLSIDSCWFTSPFRMKSQPEKLFVTIKNDSEESYTNIPLKLFINDSLKAISNFTIQPNATSTVSIDYSVNTTGLISMKLEIEDYPILYDNTYFLSYEIAAKIPIITIYEKSPNPYIQALFKKNSYFSITNQSITSIDYTAIGNYSVIILDGLQTIPSGLAQTIQKNLESGKTVLCIPHDKSDIASYNSFFAKFGTQKFSEPDSVKTSITSVDYNHLIYKNVFDKNKDAIQLPTVLKYYPFIPKKNQSILSLKNNNPFLTHISVKQGSLFVCSSPLNFKNNNFVSHPLFVGFYNIALFISSNADMQTCIGKPFHIVKPQTTSEEAFHIIHTTKKIDFIPQITSAYSSTNLTFHPMQGVKESGNYFVTLKNKKIAGISFNYNRKESDTRFYSEDKIQELLEENKVPNSNIIPVDNQILKEQITNITLGTQLWRWMLLVTLLFMLVEVFLIRFLK